MYGPDIKGRWISILSCTHFHSHKKDFWWYLEEKVIKGDNFYIVFQKKNKFTWYQAISWMLGLMITKKTHTLFCLGE